MTVTLPSSCVEGSIGSTPAQPLNHDPFPSSHIYIKGIEDTVEVLPSLQKPKKITFKGSDGKNYMMLCKPKVREKIQSILRY